LTFIILILKIFIEIRYDAATVDDAIAQYDGTSKAEDAVSNDSVDQHQAPSHATQAMAPTTTEDSQTAAVSK
jgi:hypothetical protein